MSDERTKLLSAYVDLRDSLLRFLLRRTGSREIAEDLTQETWLRLAQAGALPAVSNPRAYVFRTAVNLAADHGRHQRLLPLAEDSEAALDQAVDPQPSPERIALSRAELQRLQQLVETLPPRCRAVFLLARFENLTYAEIGLRLNMSPKTAFSHMVRALALLQRDMAGSGTSGSEK